MSWHNTLGKWPNEWGEGRVREFFDLMSTQEKEEMIQLLNAVEIDLPYLTNFDKAVELLLEYKKEGINCFIDFNWTKIFSADINTVDDAYLQYHWMRKAELEEKRRENTKELEALVKEESEEEIEKWYIKKIEDSREWKESIITKDAVINGLKFIAEHPDMEQNQLIDELIAIWCNFTLEDIEKQFPDWNLFSGMKQGDIAGWAFVIYNVMTSRYWRHYCKDRFLSNDNEISVYAFIRKISGDETYTKEYVDSLINR